MNQIPFVLTQADKTEVARYKLDLERMRRAANARDKAREDAARRRFLREWKAA